MSLKKKSLILSLSTCTIRLRQQLASSCMQVNLVPYGIVLVIINLFLNINFRLSRLSFEFVGNI